MASPPHRRTTVPHTFFTEPMRAASGPGKTRRTAAKTAAKARPSTQNTKTAHLSTATSTKAIVLDSKAARTVPNPEIESTSETACFLGLATELRCMIYNHLWTQDVDVRIMSADLDLPSMPIHPIFNVNRQIREEAIDRLHKDQSVTLHLHTVVDDFEFGKLLTVLRKLGNKYFKRDGGMLLHVNLSTGGANQQGASAEPESLGKMLASMRKYDLEWECKVPDWDNILRFDSLHRVIDLRDEVTDVWAYERLSRVVDAVHEASR